MEMMELKMKMSLLETQQDIINKVTPRNDAPIRRYVFRFTIGL
jgi:hypothetical protein